MPKVTIDGLEVDISQDKADELLKPPNSRVLNYPKEGTVYFYINSVGTLVSNRWENYLSEELKYELGNYYETKQEAEKARDKQIAMAKVNRWIEKNQSCDCDKRCELYSHNGLLTFSVMDDCIETAGVMINGRAEARKLLEELRPELKIIFDIQ